MKLSIYDFNGAQCKTAWAARPTQSLVAAGNGQIFTNLTIQCEMKLKRGFTLLEIMITLAIIGVLASVAYPSYTQYIVRANRSSASSFVLNLASRQEQYNLDSRQYTSQLSLLGAATVPTEVLNNYDVTVAVDNTATPPTYNITATPSGTQLVKDTPCGALNYDQTGMKTISGTSTVSRCW